MKPSRTNKLSAKILMIMIFKTITKLLHNKRILQAITERKKEKKEIFLLERKMVKLVELDFAFNLKSLFLRYDGWKSMICLARLAQILAVSMCNTRSRASLKFARNMVSLNWPTGGFYLIFINAHEFFSLAAILNFAIQSPMQTDATLLSQQLPALLAQQCWELLRPFVHSLKFDRFHGHNMQYPTILLSFARSISSFMK